MQHDKNYWEERWKEEQTGWDIGAASTPLKEYIDQLTDKTISILIPGCGNAYEAEYAYQKGFKNTFVLDISPKALESFQKRFPAFPKENCICGDFFNHQKQYDLIIEQTFFCALHPSMRQQYADKMHQLLKPTGKLVGLFFNCEFEGGPPYSGNKEEYLSYFKPLFNIKVFEEANNSIQPRLGRELFCILQKAAKQTDL